MSPFAQKARKPEKAYKITIKSPQGNTVGFINLTDSFERATTGKDPRSVTTHDIAGINQGKILEYLSKSVMLLEDVHIDEVIEAKNF